MNIASYKKRSSYRHLVIGLSVILIVVLALPTFYIRNLKSSIKGETTRYLNEISQLISSSVDTRVDNNFRRLKSLAQSLEETNATDKESYMGLLKRESDLYECTRMSISDLQGNSITSDNKTFNISNEEFFKKALTGQSSMSDISFSKIDSTEVVNYAVPFYKGSKIIGVITATYHKDKLRSLVDVNLFNGEGYSYIVNSSGEVIVNPSNKNAPKNITNIFNLSANKIKLNSGYNINTIQADLLMGKSGIVEFTSSGTSKLILYKPLKTNNWYLLYTIPSSVINSKTDSFVNSSIIIVATITGLFITLVLFIVITQRSNRFELENIAFTDRLTGGLNRNSFEIVASKLIKNSSKNEYAMISLNVKKFKLINDLFGSNKGNEVLKHIHKTIESNLSNLELVSRVGSDNFHILLNYSANDELSKRLKDLTASINSVDLNLSDNYNLSIAQGIFIIEDPTLDIVSIQDRAAVARKSSKEMFFESNSYTFYTDKERTRLIKEKEIQNKMHLALEHEEFVVYLQPKYELKGDTICGAEALVRWMDPDKGLIPPDDFIPIFEKNKFIIKLDQYVFEKVCKTLRQWIDNGVTPIPISFNLSRIHLDTPNFLDYFIEIYKKYDIPSNLIEFELTETLVFENMDALLSIINRIHDIGFSCSLDDFGSGYSSLNMLKDIPVDILKLDKGFFINNGKENINSHFIIESVIDLAKKLKMQIISEGIESASQLDFLKRSNCDMVQGYVFSRPIPIEKFESLAYGKEIKKSRN